MVKDITSKVFEYTEQDSSTIAQKARQHLDKDLNQFYDDGYVMLVEGDMPDNIYDYFNRHAEQIRSFASQ